MATKGADTDVMFYAESREESAKQSQDQKRFCDCFCASNEIRAKWSGHTSDQIVDIVSGMPDDGF